MIVETVDLYQIPGVSKPNGAVGQLTCYIRTNPECVSTTRRNPWVLILPGGAYRFTSPREAEPVALRFLARGYCAFVLDYSCAPLHFPVSLQEAAMAMGYIRSHAEQFQIHPHMGAAMGFSAGGHLCGTLGTMYDCPELEQQPGCADARPDAVVLCYPVAVSHGETHEESFQNVSGGDAALRERLSLDRLVRPDMPPVFLWHTRDDSCVPVRNSLVLAEALDKAGVPFAMYIYPHGNHGVSTADALVYPADSIPETSAGVPEWPERVMEFLEQQGFGIRDAQGDPL